MFTEIFHFCQNIRILENCFNFTVIFYFGTNIPAATSALFMTFLTKLTSKSISLSDHTGHTANVFFFFLKTHHLNMDEGFVCLYDSGSHDVRVHSFR